MILHLVLVIKEALKVFVLNVLQNLVEYVLLCQKSVNHAPAINVSNYALWVDHCVS
jgi:hypothetical protein